MGGDVTWIVTVASEDLAQVRVVLRQKKMLGEHDGSTKAIIRAFERIFSTYAQLTHETVAQCLRRCAITYRKEFDPWA